MNGKYVGISIPEDLAKRVDEIVKNSEHCYRSKSELCIEAIRNYVRGFENHCNNKDGGGNGSNQG